MPYIAAPTDFWKGLLFSLNPVASITMMSTSVDIEYLFVCLVGLLTCIQMAVFDRILGDCGQQGFTQWK